MYRELRDVALENIVPTSRSVAFVAETNCTNCTIFVC